MPGDHRGDPAEVYNCRCTMRAVFPDYESGKFQRVSKIPSAIGIHTVESYIAWKNRKKADGMQYFIKGKEAKTMQERTDKVGISRFQKSVNTAVANKAVDEIERFQREFGGILVSSISYLPDGSGVSYDGDYTSGRITLKNINGDNAVERLKKRAEEMHRRGQWSTSSEWHSTRHELGHGVTEYLKTQPNWELKEKKLQDIIDRERRLTSGMDLKEKSKTLASKLSIYGYESVEELASESIAEYAASKKKCRSTALEVIKILKGE